MFKQEIPTGVEVAFDLTGPVRHVDCVQPGIVSFWYEHLDGGVPYRHRFIAVGTGQVWPSGFTYVGTALSPAVPAAGPGLWSPPYGQLVWHLLTKPVEP